LYRLRNRHSTYGASQARKIGRTAKNMKFSFVGTPMFSGKNSLKVFSWLRKFVKACHDNDVSEGMGLYLIPNFLAGDADERFIRNLPGSDIAGGQGSLRSFPTAVNWLLSTYAERHALGLAQDKFSRAALVDNEGVDAFAARLRSLAELCGNIHFEGTMKQQLIQGLPEYLRTDAFVYNLAQRSYQKMLTYVAEKNRAANDVVALASRGSPGGSSRKRQTLTGPRGLSVNQLHSPWEEDDTATNDTVTVLPSGTLGFRTAGGAPYARREAPTGPPLCLQYWTRGHRVPDCKILTDKQRDLVKAARSTFLRQSYAKAGAVADRTSVVALVWDDLLGGAESTKTEARDAPPVATRAKGRRVARNAEGGWHHYPRPSPLSASTPRSPPVTSRLPPRAYPRRGVSRPDAPAVVGDTARGSRGRYCYYGNRILRTARRTCWRRVKPPSAQGRWSTLAPGQV